MTSSKHIVVTGASGFIGSSLVKKLIQKGYTPIILNRASSNSDRLKEINSYQTYTYNHLTNTNLIHKLKQRQPQAFIHLAWKGTHNREHNQPYQILDNLPLTLDSVTLANAVGCQHWIGIGSQTEYGNPNCQVNENYPTQPNTIYGQAKLASCWSGLGLCQAYNMTGTWLRLFGVYGPGDAPYHLFPYVMQEFLNGRRPKVTQCEQKWDFLYIDDITDAISHVLDKQPSGIFNLGSGQAIRLRDVVELIRSLCQSQVSADYGAIPYKPNQVMYLQSDSSKLQASTNWNSKISLEQGLQNTLDWLKQISI